MSQRRSWLAALALVCFVGTGVACSTSAERDPWANGADGGSSNGGGFGQSSNGSLPTAGAVTIKGTTYAPNGTLPLAGVLVYTVEQKPDPIPAGVYCDTCRELPEGRYAISGANGSFEFTADPGKRFVVVEKGQFRRVREIDIAADVTEIDLDDELSTLPSRSSGDDTIPKIALMVAPDYEDYDIITVALQGLGIQKWDTLHDWDMYSGIADDDRSSTSQIERLREYNIVMFPCGSGEPDAAEKTALRQFVQEGGKIYASDYSLSYATQTFAEFFTSPHATFTPSSAPAGKYVDQGLLDWLSQPEVETGNPQNTRFEGVWSNFRGVRAAEVPDETGNFASIEPKIWARTDSTRGGGTDEAAVSFQYGCGRAMASTFHVHGGTSTNLTMQEKALIYMLLDVSACAGPPVPVN